MLKNTQAFIFLCSDTTEDECLSRNLFGGTKSYFSKVKNLKVGDRLFLYNFISGRLHGEFIAESVVGTNWVREAWDGDFPLQVRVQRVVNYKPLTKADLNGLIPFFKGMPPARLNKDRVLQLEKIFESPLRLPKVELDYRRENPAEKPTSDGHWVRSWGEVTVDNWLFSNRITHGYELRVGDGLCDFLVPTDKGTIYIEFWGLEDEKYQRRKERKLKQYKKLGIQLIELFPKDLDNLEIKLGFLRHES